VEILVAEVGVEPAGDQMFHILYDGTVMDERDYAAIGGDAEAINARLAESWTDGLDRASAIRVGIAAIGGPDRTIESDDLEVADLARTNGRRCFHRLAAADLP
jgi:proteasome alpha subunit